MMDGDWLGMVGVFGALTLMNAVILVNELRWVQRWEREHGRRLLREPTAGGFGRLLPRAPDRYLFVEDRRDQAAAMSGK